MGTLQSQQQPILLSNDSPLTSLPHLVSGAYPHSTR